MTGRPVSSGFSASLVQAILETPVADEGQSLQRGGERLGVHKLPDRFTAAFTPTSAGPQPTDAASSTEPAQATAQAIGSAIARPILSGQLTEFQVSPERLESAMASTRDSDQVAFASHAYQINESPESNFYLTDQITVQFADWVTPADIETIAAAAGLQTVQSVEGMPNTFIFRLTAEARVNPLKLTNRLVQLDGVLTAEPNVAIALQSFYRPQDPYYPQQWHLQHSGGQDLATGSHISVEAAWDVTRGVRSVVVAVIDDGFDLNHPDFQGVGKIVGPRDLGDEDAVPQPVRPGENHGTAVAGLAIAEENGDGVVGVAPGCAFMPIRYPGYLDDASLEAMFDWAWQNGASVISNSWGPVAINFPLSLRQKAAINRAASKGRDGKGCVVLFAAGNSNRPVNGTINERGWPNQTVEGPTRWLNGFAVHPDVITVTACTSLGKKAAYSSWGEAVAVAAPSNNAAPGIALPQIGYTATGPVVNAPLRGRGMVSSDRLGDAGYTPSQIVGTFGGTSSACPVAAGVAALVLSANPDLTAQQVRQILQDTADKITDFEPDPQLGLRRGTYDVSGHSEWFGYGKVNAAKAVQAAQQRLTALPSVNRWIQQQNDQRIAIPDNSLTGATSAISVRESDRLQDIQIDVEVQHAFLGDLELHLISPLGDKIRLQSRTLGRKTHLQTTYSQRTTPQLQRWLNQSISGRWQILAVDYAPGDTGELLRWRISLGV